MRARLGLSALALVLALPGAASANMIYSEDCSLEPQSTFGVDQSVCVTGDFDSPCTGTIVAAGDIYVVRTGDPIGADVTHGGPNRVVTAGGAGAFYSELVWAAPLAPGDYDLIIDETCNRDAPTESVRAVRAFRVLPVMLGANVDVDALKGSAMLEQERWEGLQRNWGRLMVALRAYYIANAFYAAANGNPWELITIGYGSVTGMPVSYNGAILQLGTRIIDGVTGGMAQHYGDIVADPPDPAYDVTTFLDFSVVNDPMTAAGLPAYPYSPGSTLPLEHAYIEAANAMAEHAVLGRAFLHALERYQGARAANDNHHIHRTARHLARLAREQMASLDRLQEAVGGIRNIANLEEFAMETTDPAMLRAIQEQLARDGVSASDRAALNAHGFDDATIDAEVARVLALELPTAPHTYLDAVEGMLVTIPGARAAFEDVAREADAVVAEDAPYVREQQPLAAAGADVRTTVGVAVTLDAGGSSDPNGDALSYSWDLDADGVFGDATDSSVSITPERAGSWLVSVRVTDARGFEDVDFVVLEVGPSTTNRAPLIDAVTPAGELTVVSEGDAVAFDVTARDPEGATLAYTWTVDDAERSTEAGWTWATSAGDVGYHRVVVRVSDGDDSSADVYEQRFVSVLAEGTPLPDAGPGSGVDGGPGGAMDGGPDTPGGDAGVGGPDAGPPDGREAEACGCSAPGGGGGAGGWMLAVAAAIFARRRR